MINGLDWLFLNPLSYLVIPIAIEQKADIVKDYLLPLLPSILTILGWIVVSRQEKNSRKEQKQLLEQEVAKQKKEERISRILNQIGEIKELTFKYYQLDVSANEAIELQIIIPARLQQLNHFIARGCCENSKIPSDISKKFIKFRRALTGGYFASQQRVALPFSDILYQKIIKAEMELYIEIEKLLP